MKSVKTDPVADSLELEKNRGYWRAKGFNRKEGDLYLTRGDEVIKRFRGNWCLFDADGRRVKGAPILYTLLKTII